MRALVIDDSRAMRRIVSGILAGIGYETAEAGDGRQALDLLESGETFDLACIDWNMPVMNGLEFLRLLRREPRGDAPVVVFCSTETDPERIGEAVRSGADEYIMKPFDSGIIEAKFAEVGLV